MKIRTLYIDKLVAAEIRGSCVGMRAEDGGAIFGPPESGDIVAQIRAPSHTKRSGAFICMKATDLEPPALKLVESRPHIRFLGFWHLHFSLPDLSTGDMEELARLHREGWCPSCGIVLILAIRDGSEFIRLRAWISSKAGLLDLVDLHEVDDPVEARGWLGTSLLAPPMRPHVLGSRLGAARLERELAALSDQGVVVASHCMKNSGIELVFTHTDHFGELRLTLPAEGWERPPRIELQCRGQSRLILSPLGSMLAAWSSAYTLADLVTQARKRGVWPSTAETTANDKQGKE